MTPFQRRRLTIEKGISWLEGKGYEVSTTYNNFFIIKSKEGKEAKISIHKMITKFGKLHFKHSKSDKYRESKIYTLWVYDDVVGWNDTYFN